MDISNQAIRLIITSFYTASGIESREEYSEELLTDKIKLYFTSSTKTNIVELDTILDNFNRADNPYLEREAGQKETALSWLWNSIQTFFSEMFPSVWKGFAKMMGESLEARGENYSKYLAGVDQDKIDKFLDKFEAIGFLDKESRSNIEAQFLGKDQRGFMTYVSLTIGFILSYIQVVTGTVGGDYIKRMNTIYTPGVPTAESLIHGLRLAPELKDRFFKVFKENGLSDNDIELMLISAYNVYDVDTIRQLYLRGTITKDKMIERMGELGYTPERIQDLTSLWEVIPPVQDILYMVAKESFEPEEVAKLGLSAEFPEDVSQWLTKQGLSRDWQEKYWSSHWAMPSIQQAFEMYHRRVIDADMLNSLFKTVELPPYWRDKLTAIAYSPYTRVDIRRMHLMGTVSIEEVYNNYLDLGYDSEHAEKMTEWTINYNENSERSLTKKQIESAYKDDVITRAEALEWFQSLGYTESLANFSLDYVDYLEEKSYQDNIIDIVKDSYSANLMDRDEAVHKLNEINITSRKIDYLIERWTIRKIANRKLPSKTDLEKFLNNNIIDINTYMTQLRIIGYEDKYIQWYAALQLPKE